MKWKLRALVDMAHLGQCYKSDFAMLIRKGERYESEVQDALIDEGYIREKMVTKSVVDSRNPKVAVVAITKKGRAYLCDALHTERYASPAPALAKFNTADIDKLNRYLGDSRIMILMHKAGVRALPYEKPSLYHMYMHLSHEVELSPEKYDHTVCGADEYDNTLDLDEVMNDGVYYSVEEFRNFVRIQLEERIEDTFQGARFRGILVTRNQIILVYLSNVFDNKRVKLSSGQEERGINIVEHVFSKFNQVESVNALVISSGNALVVDMALCGRNGIAIDKSIRALNLVDNSCELFEHIYVVPHNLAGIDSLSYIAHHTFEQWSEDASELFEDLPGFELIPDEFIANDWLLARDIEKDTRAIFVPYYDIKMLDFIHTFHEDISIVTYPDMADTISHSIRRGNAIYDVDGNLLDVQRYQKSGKSVGDASIKKEKTRKKSLKMVGVNISLEEKKKIEKMTRANGTSVSSYIRKLIRMHLEEDYELFEQQQKSERIERRK